MQESKTCTVCQESLSFDNYSKSTASKNGFKAQCKKCLVKKSSEYNAVNSEKRKLYAKDYRANNAEKIQLGKEKCRQAKPEQYAATKKRYYLSHKQEVLAYDKKWTQANSDKVRITRRDYQRRNPEKAFLIAKQWAKDNPELRRASTSKRRASKRLNGVKLVTKKELLRLYASPCAYCGIPSKHIDHVIPISKGGSHSIGNLVGACAPCNLSKGSKLITEWKKDRGW